jgi:hypothetical protein
LFLSAENKPASKSAQNLFSREPKSKISLNKVYTRRNTEHSPQNDFSPQLDLKNSYLFLNLDHQKDIQQCESIFELAG